MKAFHKRQVSGKVLQIEKMSNWKVLRKNILKSSEAVVYICSVCFCSIYICFICSENSKQILQKMSQPLRPAA